MSGGEGECSGALEAAQLGAASPLQVDYKSRRGSGGWIGRRGSRGWMNIEQVSELGVIVKMRPISSATHRNILARLRNVFVL